MPSIQDITMIEAGRKSLKADRTASWKNQRILGRIAEVDGLRGLAILLVLFFHYVTSISAPGHRLWGFVTKGSSLFWSGVDLFFVLSGFLISGILMDSIQSTGYFRTFYLRRIHRIFPLYFGWLTLFYLAAYLDLDGKLGIHVFQSRAALWLYPLFLQNNAPLWFDVELPLWMAMSWSLAVEEQFYLVLPAVVRFVGKPALTSLSVAVIILSPAYRFILLSRYPGLNVGWPFATLSRLDGLAMGVVIALLVRNETCWRWLTIHVRILRISGLVLLVAFAALTCIPPTQLSMALYGFSIIAIFYAAVLLLAVCHPASLIAGLLKGRILRYFGKVSYAVYIFHQGVHGLLDRLVPPWGHRFNALRVTFLTVLALATTILLAESSWRFIESSLIKRSHVRYRY